MTRTAVIPEFREAKYPGPRGRNAFGLPPRVPDMRWREFRDDMA
jgi:hypothetical protein